ncbi:MAG: excinuclease ABC subunit UvrC [Candidatus Hodarchaeota archaeon]
MKDLDLQRKSLPNEPGIYIFCSKDKSPLYIGKASNIRKRVNQYFSKSTYNDPYYGEKIKDLIQKVDSIEYIVTENEKEAYILENIQIKNFQPRYNVIMRDSKSYPWVAIFYSEEYPRIRVIRGPEKYSKENLFIGPYTDKKEIIRILRDLRKIFPYCSCKKKVKKRERPCLYYQIKLCSGPCIEAIDKDLYLENIKNIELFLKGETEELKMQIKEKMDIASQNLNFEIAAFWRNKLQAIDHSTSDQSVLLNTKENKDIIGYYGDENQNFFAMVIIHIRDGKITNKSSFSFNLKDKIFEKEDIFPLVMEQFYQDTKGNLPDTVVIPERYKNIEVFTLVLKDYKNQILIRTPIENEYGLIRIAQKNAQVLVQQEIQMEEIKSKEQDIIDLTLSEVKHVLNLPDVPKIIEGFDISNIEGTDATGSMVYFLNGKPYKKFYRHYNIKGKSTPDDVAMIREVIKRRYNMVLQQNIELPDLILVDGGKGQLNAGISVLKELGIEEIPIIGLAKKLEEIYLPNSKDPILLPIDSLALKLFQQVRNEAHRFAVRLHKKQREKRIKGSILDEIKGVGPATRNKLLKFFGSVENIKIATLEEVSTIIGKKLAKIILEELNK